MFFLSAIATIAINTRRTTKTTLSVGLFIIIPPFKLLGFCERHSILRLFHGYCGINLAQTGGHNISLLYLVKLRKHRWFYNYNMWHIDYKNEENRPDVTD